MKSQGHRSIAKYQANSKQLEIKLDIFVAYITGANAYIVGSYRLLDRQFSPSWLVSF